MPIPDRFHALDAVRGFALLSGIVLHATMSFMPGLAAIGFPADSSQSATLQALFYVIHTFRMPLFFVVAGLLAQQMLERKGIAGFVRDRAKRILVPLVAGWVVFGPAAMALVYVALGPPIDRDAVPQLAGFPLGHLWFLYYLAWFYVIALVVRQLLRGMEREGTARTHLRHWLRATVRAGFGPALLAGPVAGCFLLTPGWVPFSGIASPDTGLALRWLPMIGFGTAFAFGWWISSQGDLLSGWQGRWRVHCGLAAGLTALAYWILPAGDATLSPSANVAYVVCYALAMWLWVFGVIGAAVRFFSTEHPALRYLADASYWMYLAHLPLVFALQLVVRTWPMHWAIKSPLIVAVTCAVLLVTYRYIVRSTVIGQILNGRKRARTISQRAPERSVVDTACTENVVNTPS